MKYEYRYKAEERKLLTVNTIQGLPRDISLKFSNMYIRFCKVENTNAYFFCTLAIPKMTGDEGYVLELEFSSKFRAEDDFSSFIYEVPFQEHTFKSLPKSISCTFEDKTEMGQRMLLLNMTIKGTPFNGYVLLNQDLYAYQQNA